MCGSRHHLQLHSCLVLSLKENKKTTCSLRKERLQLMVTGFIRPCITIKSSLLRPSNLPRGPCLHCTLKGYECDPKFFKNHKMGNSMHVKYVIRSYVSLPLCAGNHTFLRTKNSMSPLNLPRFNLSVFIPVLPPKMTSKRVVRPVRRMTLHTTPTP